jgi:hypothetical protein
MRPAKSAKSHKNVVPVFTQSHITTNSAHADKEREITMEFHIEFYNTIASVAWAFVTFTLVGMVITRKRGK